MTTRVINVPVGSPQTFKPSGFPMSFTAVPSGGGSVLMDFSIDNGFTYIPHPLGSVSTVHSLSTGLIASLAGVPPASPPTTMQGLPPGAIVRCTATTAAATLVACELGGPFGTNYQKDLIAFVGGAGAGGASLFTTPNSTSELTVWSMRFPAGFLPANFGLSFDFEFTCTNSANVKTLKCYVGNSANTALEGGTICATQVLTSSSGGRMAVKAYGRNDGSSISVSSIGAALGYGISTTAPIVVSSSAAYALVAPVEQVFYVTATKATGSETLTLDSVEVRLSV